MSNKVKNGLKMAIGVDTSKWKPRKIKGTPAHIVRNRIAYGILGFGAICSLVFHYSNVTLNLRNATNFLLTDPEEEIERKQMIFSSLRQKTGDQFRRQMEAEQNPALPYK